MSNNLHCKHECMCYCYHGTEEYVQNKPCTYYEGEPCHFDTRSNPELPFEISEGTGNPKYPVTRVRYVKTHLSTTDILDTLEKYVNNESYFIGDPSSGLVCSKNELLLMIKEFRKMVQQ